MPDRGRRRFLSAVPGALLALDLPAAYGATIVAVRVWPAKDYTRVTLELDSPLRTSHFTVPDPPRMVVDLEGVEIDAALRELVAKVQANDPYIAAVRVGQNRPRVTRLVFDLKAAVAPQVFTLPPVAAYRHRLVVDLHPALPRDPLTELVDPERPATAGPRSGGPTGVGAPAAAGAALPGADAGAPAGAASSRSATAPAAASTTPSAIPPPTPSASVPPAAETARSAGSPSNRAAGARPAGGARPDPLAALLRERDPSLRPREFERLVTIAIDPGHGGEDPGAIGRFGTMEKDVVLAIAAKLRDRIAAEPNMRAFMTRDSDFYVPLSSRVAKARAVRADLFVSVHADAFVRPHARGSSVFVLSDRSATSVGARWLARRENRADLIGGVNLPRRNREAARVLLDMTTSAQIVESKRLGSAVLGELRSIGDLHKVSVEQAGFAVLRAPDIPSILVETAFISNPDEERKLRDPRYQARLADAMLAGIRRYFRRHPPGPRGRSA